METSSSENSNSSQFPLFDICLNLNLLFLSLTCYDIIRSFLSSYWSFQQSHHDHGSSSKVSSSSSSGWGKTQNFECSSKQVSSTEKKEDGGKLCGKEVENLMGNLGLFWSHESEDQDQLNGSFIGSDELVRLFEEEPSLEEVKQAFDVFDLNKDGFIDAAELQRVLCIMGLKEGLSMENCNKMIKTFDDDKNGRIDFQEFAKLMEKSLC